MFQELNHKTFEVSGRLSAHSGELFCADPRK